MKTSITFRNITLIALLGAALAAPVMAQPGPGAGGMRGGPCVQNAEPGAVACKGRGAGPRGMQFSQDNTRGWTLMTPEERTAHREKMLSAKTYDECKALQAEHRVVMEARAKEKGVTLPAPRQNSCDRMKAGGLFK